MKKLLAIILASLMLLPCLAVIALADEPVVFAGLPEVLVETWDYESTFSATLASGTPQSIKWQVSDTKDGAYADIEGATSLNWVLEYTEYENYDGKWIKCVADGAETEPFMFVNLYNYSDACYVTNGKFGYCVTKSGRTFGFDVIAFINGEWTSYSYAQIFQIFAINDETLPTSEEANYTYTYGDGIEAISFKIGEDGVVVSIDFQEGYTYAGIYTDVEFGGRDSAAIKATNDASGLKQITVYGERRFEDVTANTPSGTMIFDADRPLMYDIGYYNDVRYWHNGNQNSVEDKDSGLALTFEIPEDRNISFKISLSEKSEPIKAEKPSRVAFIYVNEKYHAMLIGGKFLCMPHNDSETGFCPTCRADLIPTVE